MAATRRAFLQSSLIALGLPLSASLKPGIFSEERRLRVVTDTVCDDTRRFATMCGRHVEAIDVDPSRCLSSLEDDFRAHRIDLVFGLSFDSNRFLVEQIALQYAFRRDYLGMHDFRSGRFSHRLEGHGRFVDALGDAVETNPASWIEAMASSLSLLSSPDSTEKAQSTGIAPAQGTGSAAYLVSWSLRRV
ncbi:MAG: hypothetical protein VX929_05725 [Pseudomonadota bacterium]|nr:hypothetical protein [Pseudomonadota bacterium]